MYIGFVLRFSSKGMFYRRQATSQRDVFASIVLRRTLIVRNWIGTIVAVFGEASTGHIFGITFKAHHIWNIIPHELYETAIYFYTHFLMFASVAASPVEVLLEKFMVEGFDRL